MNYHVIKFLIESNCECKKMTYKKIQKNFCYAVTIFLVNIMLRILVYFTNRKKLIYVIFFVAIALSVIQYMFSLRNNNGKLDFCLDDVVFSSQHLKDIKCSILESQDQEKCQENWIKSDEFISDNQVQNRLSNCSPLTMACVWSSYSIAQDEYLHRLKELNSRCWSLAIVRKESLPSMRST